MKIKPARRVEKIVYAIRNIVTYAKELEKKGLKVTYLNIGDPIIYDFKTPGHMIESVNRSMVEGINGYVHSFGLSEAREAISRDEISKGKEGISESDIIISSGASEAIEMVLTALLNEENNILLPAPGYPLYNAVISKIGAHSKNYLLDPENGWQPDLNNIESLIDKNTRAIVVINPNNPTGACYNEETLKGIINIAQKYNLIILSDEIYDRLIFDDHEMLYFGNLTKEVPIISFNGLSKNYLAPGWRIGWMIFQNMKNEIDFISAIKRIAEARLCSVGPMQSAVSSALDGDKSHIKEALSKLEKRRDICFDRLNSISRIKCVKPQAAFYAMPVVEGIEDDEKFMKDLLKQTGILCVHGSGFGMKKNDGAFRVVFLPDEKTLNFAFDKLEKFVKNYSD